MFAQHPSPMALVIRAHLHALRTRGHPELLMREKIALVWALRERGYTHEQIIDLYKAVDFIMALPKEYEELVQHLSMSSAQGEP